MRTYSKIIDDAERCADCGMNRYDCDCDVNGVPCPNCGETARYEGCASGRQWRRGYEVDVDVAWYQCLHCDTYWSE